MDDEDFQYLLAAQLAKDEELDGLHGNDEVDPVLENGWNDIPQEPTKHV